MSQNIVHEAISSEHMVSSYYADVQQLKQDLKDQRAMLKDAYENDAEYSQVQEDIKALQRKRSEIKERIEKDASIQLIKEKISDLNSEKKDGQMALFDYVYKFTRETGVNRININGELFEIVPEYKLRK